MVKPLWLILFISSVIQSTEKKPVLAIPIVPTAAAVDLYGNIYIVNDRLDLMVFKGNADTFKRFYIGNYGSNPIIDVSNALEVFVFNPSNGSVVWFDNQLNMQGSLDLFTAGIFQTAAIGRSNDGNVWAMDNNTKTLKKINRNGQVVLESVIIMDFSFQSSANLIFDNGEVVVIEDEARKKYVFNRNLNLQNTKSSIGRLMGLSQNEIITKESGFIGRTNIRSSDKNMDTVCITNKWDKVIGFNHPFYITADSIKTYQYSIKK